MQNTRSITININDVEVIANVVFNYTQGVNNFNSGDPDIRAPSEPEEFEPLSLTVVEDGDRYNCDWMLKHIEEDIIEQLKVGDED